MLDLSYITSQTIFGFLLIGCRVGAILMTLPGIGEMYVTARTRLIIALVISFLLTPIIAPFIPTLPKTILGLFVNLFQEIWVGVFLGSIVRILFTVMSTAGLIIATQSGLGSAMLFDPNQGTQGAIIGNFLGGLAVTLIFITDMHHIFINGIKESYTLFNPTQGLMHGDLAESMIQIVSKSFEIAIKISAPQIIVGLLIMIAAGVLSRLMPSIQIFFILAPAQILISFFILMVTFTAGFSWYMDNIAEIIHNFLIK
jgi:flagellar biosynthetic protein FliR